MNIGETSYLFVEVGNESSAPIVHFKSSLHSTSGVVSNSRCLVKATSNSSLPTVSNTSYTAGSIALTEKTELKLEFEGYFIVSKILKCTISPLNSMDKMSSTGDNTATTATSPSVDHSSSDPKIVAKASETDTCQVPPLPTSETKVSSKSNRSWVWEHYVVVTGTETKDKKATCKYCEQLIACASKNGTTSLSNHLHRCKKYPYNSTDKRQKTLEFKPKEGGGKALTTHMFDQEACRRMLARMVIIDELPFKFVEREGFLDFCLVMQPRFEMPSRRTITTDCHKLFLDEKKSLKAYFETLSSRICLTTDAWTSIQNLNYLCLTAHFIDDKWKLHKKILSFCPITSHAGEVIGRTVEKCLLDWKISKVLTVTVDNASSNDTCLQYLRRRLINWKCIVLNGEYLHMRCAAHVLNLTVREGLKDLEDSIVRIRSAVRYVRSSPARAQRFKSCIEKERIESKNLVCLDVETRWNSTFLMLEAALKFQKAFELLETVDSKYVEELTPQSENDTRKSSKMRGVPTEMDWEYAKDLLPFLQIFYDSTVKMSGSRYVTGNVYMNEIFGIGGLLNSFQESDDFGLSTMAGNMKKKYDKYWGNVERINILILIAVVLDPRHKLSYVQWAIDEDMILRMLKF
ncbi:zinc finger BED domain-containing protein RICESLEEPER 2-like [Coffea eugenioides]|uniref:zinc finger BED domain-containing protein RICESLEEPER 2-like n=2 Tax=Coffea eugenioides TaxID=49369 RepID=UPI000F6113E4|nr:zinc finger BED domain-containing protein RICESLEEPER 2-like [Coffea eugenioides]XP_027181629.1 zinc finger BED domain-containing protein RICESLEEPER 2-like [Coffea eugenioides]